MDLGGMVAFVLMDIEPYFVSGSNSSRYWEVSQKGIADQLPDFCNSIRFQWHAANRILIRRAAAISPAAFR